jgi:hypothetical protein
MTNQNLSNWSRTMPPRLDDDVARPISDDELGRSLFDEDFERPRTGPKTPEGRNAVAKNAVKHGLSGAGLILPEKESGKALRREEELVSEYSPRDHTEALLVKKMAIHSVKAEQAYQLQIEARARAVERAHDHWRTDRRANITKLTSKLASEPDRIVRLLFQSLDGLDWLLERWRHLLGAADSDTGWNEDQRKLALDLMGIPLEFQENPPIRVTSADPAERKRIQTELAGQRTREIEELHLANAQRSDEADRDRALRGYESTTDRELLLYRRYERDAWRHFDQACAELRRIQAERKGRSSWNRDAIVDLNREDHEAEFGPRKWFIGLPIEKERPDFERMLAEFLQEPSESEGSTPADETVSADLSASQPAKIEAAPSAPFEAESPAPPKPLGESRLATKQFPSPLSLLENLRADSAHSTPEKPRGNRRHRKMLAAQQRKLAAKVTVA